MLRIALLLLAAVTLSGCVANLSKSEDLAAAPTGNTGVLIGSFTRNPEARAYYSQGFYFKHVQTGKVHQIHTQQAFNIFGTRTRDDFYTDTSAGSVFTFTLPAGKYVFHNYSLYSADGVSARYWSSKEDYAIPFEVHPHTTNYVGEIKLETRMGKNLFGMKIHAGGVWFFSDQKERDLEWLRKLHPNLPLTNVISVIPDRKDVPIPLVVLPSEAQKMRQGATDSAPASSGG